MLMHTIRSKIPARQEILAVFSTAAFIAFSWTIYRMFFQVPSWLFYLNLADMLWITAYVLAFALLESAFLLGFLVLLALIYPAKRFSQKFVAQSTLLILVLTIGALLYQQHIGMLKWWGLLELVIFILAFVASVTILVFLFSLICDRFTRLKKLLDSLADRLTVFGFLYLPLGTLGLVVVILRNLFFQ